MQVEGAAVLAHKDRFGLTVLNIRSQNNQVGYELLFWSHRCRPNPRACKLFKIISYRKTENEPFLVYLLQNQLNHFSEIKLCTKL